MNKETERNPQISHLEEGDVIELEKGQTVYAEIAERYVYKDTLEPDKPRKAEVTIGEDYGGLDTSLLAGRYAVVKTEFDGGGNFGMWADDYYPDGHHVWCKKMLENGDLGEQVHFYQSGFKNAMIEEIKPVGKVEFKYFEVRNNKNIF